MVLFRLQELDVPGGPPACLAGEEAQLLHCTGVCRHRGGSRSCQSVGQEVNGLDGPEVGAQPD